MNTDWSRCAEVETVPGKMNGQPILKGTRIRVQTIVDNYEAGSSIEEIAENYPSAPIDKIRKVIAFANSHAPQPVENSSGRGPSPQAADASAGA